MDKKMHWTKFNEINISSLITAKFPRVQRVMLDRVSREKTFNAESREARSDGIS